MTFQKKSIYGGLVAEKKWISQENPCNGVCFSSKAAFFQDNFFSLVYDCFWPLQGLNLCIYFNKLFF